MTDYLIDLIRNNRESFSEDELRELVQKALDRYATEVNQQTKEKSDSLKMRKIKMKLGYNK